MCVSTTAPCVVQEDLYMQMARHSMKTQIDREKKWNNLLCH